MLFTAFFPLYLLNYKQIIWEKGIEKMNENIKCCICHQSKDGIYLRTPYGTNVCTECAAAISYAITSYIECLEKGLSDDEAAKKMNTKILNNLRKDNDDEAFTKFINMLKDFDMECDEDELSRAIADDPELEDEYDLFHPRLIELVQHRYDINSTDVLVRLYKHAETPKYAGVKRDEMLVAADVFCELYYISREKKNVLSHLKQSLRKHPLLQEIDKRIQEIIFIELEMYSSKQKQDHD